MLRPPIPPGFIEPCLPTVARCPPSGPGWRHEVKHDGYRLLAWRDGDTVRLFTRNGFDWQARYPAIVAAVAKLKVRSCLIDGEVILVGITAAVVQQTVRAATNLKKSARPSQAARLIMGVDAVTKQRMKALVAVTTVKAYNKAKLATYAINGGAQVGVVPELREAPPARVVPAPRKKRILDRLPARKRASDADPVGILTAGDDFVCQECEDYAGPDHQERRTK